MHKIIVLGSSGHAKVIIDIIEKSDQYQIVGLLDRYRSIGDTTMGYEVLGQEEHLPELTQQYELHGIIVAVGDNALRAQLVETVRSLTPDLIFVKAIHPNASVSRDVEIGEGTVVMSGVTINASCRIGGFCILNTHSSLDHDSIMDDFSSLAPGVCTGGNCRIGEYSAIGIGAKLKHQIDVGEHTVIGAGAVVTESIDAYTTAYGTPARAVQARGHGDKYL